MAMQPCADCDTPLSPYARNCPNCRRYTRFGLGHIYGRLFLLSWVAFKVLVIVASQVQTAWGS
jgi:hypothetical protein